MPKVTFTFDEMKDREDVNMIVNRHKLICAINALSDMYSAVYNGKLYNNEQIYVKEDGKVATKEDYEEVNKTGTYLSGGKHYLDQDWVENKLNTILEDVRQFLWY